jgi:streptogramin lyase
LLAATLLAVPALACGAVLHGLVTGADGRMDVASGEIRLLDLPYGLDIDPVDGSVWCSKLYANRIGRVDPRTLEIEEFATPRGGPRRMRSTSTRAPGTSGSPAISPTGCCVSCPRPNASSSTRARRARCSRVT